MDFIKELESELIEMNTLPDFGSGDTVDVSYKIKEGASLLKNGKLLKQ